MELNNNNLNEDMLSRAATWFAGYAVMRWHLGYELGDLYMQPDGMGEWLAPPRPPIVTPSLGPIQDHEAPLTPEEMEATGVPEVLRDAAVYALPPDVAEEIHANLAAMLQAAPRKHHIVMMDLAACVGEYGEAIPDAVNEWPTSWLDNARKFFTPAYCQSAFERPMQYNEAVLYCLGQAKAVVDQYASLHWHLARELFGRFMRGELEISGPEITDRLHRWRAETALP